MSSGDNVTLDVSGVASRIQAVRQDVVAVNQLLASARRVRLWLILVVVVWLGAVVWSFLGMVNRVLSEEFRKEMTEAARPQIDAQTAQVKSQAEKFWNNAQPVLTEAFNKQWEKDTEKFTSSLESQRDLLKENLQKRVEEELKGRYEKIVEKHRKLLEAEFPVVKDEETHQRMVDNLSVAMTDLVEKYYFEEFKRHLARMDKTWEDFPMVDAPDPKDPEQSSLASQLVVELLDLVPLLITASQEIPMEEGTP
jgi:hypothetical protein